MYVQTAANFVLDDSASGRIPAGAYLHFDNRVNTQGSYYLIYPSISPVSPVTVTNGQAITFFWTGRAWTTNTMGTGTTTNAPAPPAPPTNLHFLN